MTAIVTEEEALKARYWITQWAQDYHGEVPMRIHANHHGQHFGLGAAPPFAPEFVNYIGKINCKDDRCRQCRDDLPIYFDGEGYRTNRRDERTRVTRAFRKLSRAAPLEHDVLRMIVVYGLSVNEVASRLNERAIRKGHADRYDTTTVTMLVILGVDKVAAWM